MKGAAGKPIRDPRPPTHDDALLLVTILNGAVGEQALDGMELLWTYPEPPSYDGLTRDHPPGSVGFRNVMACLPWVTGSELLSRTAFFTRPLRPT